MEKKDDKAAAKGKQSSSALPFPEKYYADPMGLDRYVVQERTLIEWRAPSKLDSRRTPKDYALLMLFFAIITIILFLLQEYFLAVVVGILGTLFFLVLTAPPTFLTVQVTTIGIKIEEKYYYWEQISQFWFDEKGAGRGLYFRNLFPNVHVLSLHIFSEDEEALRTTIGTYLLYKKPQQTFIEKWREKITRQLPFELP